MSHRPTPRASLSVSLFWQHDRIAYRRLSSRGALTVGAAPDSIAQIPTAPATTKAFEIARIAGDSSVALACVPAGAIGGLRRAGGAFELVFGPAEEPLACGDALHLALGEFFLVVEADPSTSDRLPAGASSPRAPGALAHVAIAALAHVIVLGLAAHAAMAKGLDEDDDGDRVEAMQKLMVSAEQRARAADPHVDQSGGEGSGRSVNGRAGNGKDGGGARARGEEGAMGDRRSRAAGQGHYTVAAQNKKDETRSLAREQALADAASFGMIGLVGQGALSPTPWFASADARGGDAFSARGSMLGFSSGYHEGAGGLGLTGIGEGGGGRGEGIGLGALGTIGHTWGREGAGTGGDGSPANGSGWGVSSGSYGGGHGRLGGSHRTRPPITCRLCYASVSGRLPPEVVQRIVRQNFGRFRACYENGIRANPTLAGTVSTSFVIGRDGSVMTSASSGGSLNDPSVVSCVTRAFYGISFPQPEGGVVSVTYPIAFSHD